MCAANSHLVFRAVHLRATQHGFLPCNEHLAWLRPIHKPLIYCYSKTFYALEGRDQQKIQWELEQAAALHQRLSGVLVVRLV